MDINIYKSMAEVEKHHWWFRARRAIIGATIKSLNLEPNASILEIGSGTGGNFKMLSQYGKLTAIEMDQGARELARMKIDMEIHSGYLPNGLPDLKQQFDLVVLLDVLEHVDEDSRSIQRIEKIVKPGGYLLITVPANPSMWGIHDEAHHHFRRYKLPSLIETASGTGFALIKASYFNTILFPLIAGYRLVEKLFGNHQGTTGLKIPPKPINNLLDYIFSSERYVLSKTRFPFGVSIIAIWKKRKVERHT